MSLHQVTNVTTEVSNTNLSPTLGAKVVVLNIKYEIRKLLGIRILMLIIFALTRLGIKPEFFISLADVYYSDLDQTISH